MVKDMMDAFMTRGTRGAMHHMKDLRTYSMAGQGRTTAVGHIQWRGDDELLYKRAQFNMGQFRGLVHGLFADGQRIMREELLFCGKELECDIPAVNWFELYDDPTNSHAGFSFLKDKRTRLAVDGELWLFNRIGARPELRQEFERAGSSTGIDRPRVEHFVANARQFREKLLLLMHITGG
jgi:hypothetical protein